MNGCEGYEAIARVYDKLNAEIDYTAWADFFEKCFDKYLAKKPSLVLDLACGTGRMTRELARRGYDMIGVDMSVDMLNVAKSKNEDVLYLCQNACETWSHVALREPVQLKYFTIVPSKDAFAIK